MSKVKDHVGHLHLVPENNAHLLTLCGHLEENYRQLAGDLQVKITRRGHEFSIVGEQSSVNNAITVLQRMYQYAQKKAHLEPSQVHLLLQEVKSGMSDNEREAFQVKTQMGLIRPKGKNQHAYLANILNHDITFGIGPAGTGKTFLAVVAAINALEREQVKRLVLVRPAVEAGESLGFLPGDFSQKVEPYLRPLYDALFDLMGEEWLKKRIERNQIEVAPLAYMRGRTLNDSFIIMDEAQNTTIEQMKMFLTRLGFGSTAVVTGDVTQIDLPSGKLSGLKHAERVLKGIDGIQFTAFAARDAVRHRLVQAVIQAYESYESEHPHGKQRY